MRAAARQSVRFLFVCEGSSDTPLVDHIQRLLIHLEQPDPDGESWHHLITTQATPSLSSLSGIGGVLSAT